MISQYILWLQYGLSKLGIKDEGQGLAEYALILVLIAIVLIAALTFLEGGINAALVKIGTELRK